MIATDQPNLILSNEIHPSLHTNCHHQINAVNMNLKCPLPPPHERRVWHYGRANIEAIRRSFLNYNWSHSLQDTNPEDQVEHFDEVILNVANTFIPFDDKLIKPQDPPWITKHSKNFYTKYRRKFKQFIKNGCKQNDKVQIDAMKQEYTSSVEKNKDKYYSSLGSSLSNPLLVQKNKSHH